MKSRVVSYYDYKKLEIPEELTRWHIPDEEIWKELEFQAGDHAVEKRAEDAVKIGDSVRCVCVKASKEKWKDRVILLYPGRNLPGAEDAEEAVLGKASGESVCCSFGEVQMELLVQEILRMEKLPVGDELVKSLELFGVSTVEEYFCWYREKNNDERKTKAGYGIISYWLRESAARSEFAIDEEEKKAWCLKRAKLQFEALLAAGIDRRIPSEGFEILTDEQAIDKIAKEQEEYFVPFLIFEYMCRLDGYVVTENEFEEDVAKIAAERGMSFEEAMKQTEFSAYQEMKYKEHLFLGMSKAAQAELED